MLNLAVIATGFQGKLQFLFFCASLVRCFNYICCPVGQVQFSSTCPFKQSTCPRQALMSSSVAVYKIQPAEVARSDRVTPPH